MHLILKSEKHFQPGPSYTSLTCSLKPDIKVLGKGSHQSNRWLLCTLDGPWGRSCKYLHILDNLGETPQLAALQALPGNAGPIPPDALSGWFQSVWKTCMHSG